MTPTTRQPFANLDAPRMRSIMRSKMNLKNQRDGLLASKRQPLSVMDAENIDPVTRLAAKRKRGCDEDVDDTDSLKAHGPTKPIKASRMALTTVAANPPPRKSTTTTTIPVTPRKPLQTATTAPCKSPAPIKPMGRSPQPARPSPRRSNIAKPASAPASRRTVKRPFSIATALSGGKPKAPASAKTTPASWAFDIHVDSEQDELTNLMQHSTCVLDISDDERKADDAVAAGRGKENIPPAELGLGLAAQPEVPAPTLRKEKMLDEPRAPLGELNAPDYYPDGCHAFSYEVVYEDEGDEENVPVAETKPSRHQRSRSKLSSVSSIATILDATAPKDASGEPQPAEVEIWESESAAEENAE
ncbi:hypothetical protein BO80DRAFT_25579 [Aspergillus terreus]|uniref:Uncharacterized protein n=1 Tax=Aspergillus terreus TaxID=33178 RepID=A0A5M3YQZ7_ASPTE|nr:hypothetical protein ATETN484_0002030200 [Aspergillus terreus]GFF15158.1 hypothetical protein BO80DRAFT_25579 [Aspergillus terreus]